MQNHLPVQTILERYEEEEGRRQRKTFLCILDHRVKM